MNTSEWLNLSAPGTTIGAAQSKEIAEMLTRNPWFAYARIVQLKAMKQQQDPSFDEQLRFASLYAGSRKKLHEFLRNVAPMSIAHPSSNEACSEPMSVSPMLVRDTFELLPPETKCDVELGG